MGRVPDVALFLLGADRSLEPRGGGGVRADTGNRSSSGWSASFVTVLKTRPFRLVRSPTLVSPSWNIRFGYLQEYEREMGAGGRVLADRRHARSRLGRRGCWREELRR